MIKTLFTLFPEEEDIISLIRDEENLVDNGFIKLAYDSLDRVRNNKEATAFEHICVLLQIPESHHCKLFAALSCLCTQLLRCSIQLDVSVEIILYAKQLVLLIEQSCLEVELLVSATKQVLGHFIPQLDVFFSTCFQGLCRIFARI